MTLHEAYLKAKSDGARSGRTQLWDCRDYGDFWGFMFSVPAPPGRDYPVPGTGDIAVNKKTGDIAYFVAPKDLDIMSKAKPIPVEQFTEYNVAI